MNDDICSICYENLDSKPTHTLECGHTYHTDCIIKWFRSSNNSNGRCALCNSEQLANGETYLIPWHARGYIKERVRHIRNISRRKNANPKIVKEVLKLKKIEEAHKSAKKNISAFKKRDDVKLLMKERTKLFRKRYSTYSQINKQKARIVSMFPMTHVLTTHAHISNNSDWSDYIY